MSLDIEYSILVLLQIIVDLILLVAFWLIHKRLQFLNPKKLDELIALLKENEALVDKVADMGAPTIGSKETGEEVLELFNNGRSPEEISSILGLTVTEVELALQKIQKKGG